MLVCLSKRPKPKLNFGQNVKMKIFVPGPNFFFRRLYDLVDSSKMISFSSLVKFLFRMQLLVGTVVATAGSLPPLGPHSLFNWGIVFLLVNIISRNKLNTENIRSCVCARPFLFWILTPRVAPRVAVSILHSYM